MDAIRLVVLRARRRLAWESAGRTFARALAGLAVFVCLAVLVDKCLFLGMSTVYAIAAAACATLAFATWRAVRRWPGPQESALAIDERLRLAERISSALAVAPANSPMERAVVDDARAYARAVPVAETFPVGLHREFWVVFLVAGVALGMLAWMPQWDLLARRERMERARREQQAVQSEASKMRRELTRLRKHAARQGLERARLHMDKMARVISAMEKGKMTRSEAMAKLSELADSLKQAQKGLRRNTALPTPAATKAGLDMAREFAKALAARNFPAAAAELTKLRKMAASNKLTQEQMEKLQRELDALAKALADCKELSDLLMKCAACLGEGDLAKFGEGLAQCKWEMDKMAQLAAELEMLSACAGLCKGGKGGLGGRLATWGGTGVYSQGDNRGMGPGMGRPGIGAGGVAPVNPEDVDFQSTMVKGRMKPGRVVGSFFVDGQQIKGEAKARYVEQVRAAQSEAAQALHQEKIPRAYERYVRDYFQGMKSK